MSSGSSGGPPDPFLESSGNLPAASSSAGPETPSSDAAADLVTADPNSDLLFYTETGTDTFLGSDGSPDAGQSWSDGQSGSDPFTGGQAATDPWDPYYVDPSQNAPTDPGPTNPYTAGGQTEPFTGTSAASGSSFQPATPDGTAPGAPTDLGTTTVNGQSYHVYGQIIPDSPPVTQYTFTPDVITATPDPPSTTPSSDAPPVTQYTFPPDLITATPDLPSAAPAPVPAATPSPDLGPVAPEPAPTPLGWSLPPLTPPSSLPALPGPSPLAPLPVEPPTAPTTPTTAAGPRGPMLSSQPTMSARDPAQPEIELPAGLNVAQYLGGYLTVLQWQDPDGNTQSYVVKRGMPATTDSDPLGTIGPNRNAGGSAAIIAAVMAGANPDQIKAAGQVGQGLADLGMAAAPAAAGLVRSLERNPLETEPDPTDNEQLPRHPAEDFVNPDYMIDTSSLAGSGKTALGYTRNNRAFWGEMLSQYPWLFSPTNVQRINQGLAPRVDQQWLDYHPGQVLYEGDILVHHHWDQGPMAFGIPQEFHRLFYPELHPFQE